MQKRLKLKEPVEVKLCTSLRQMKEKFSNKLRLYESLQNTDKTRRNQLKIWAITGLLEHNLEFMSVLVVYDRYEELRLAPPTHYNFPEFYRF